MKQNSSTGKCKTIMRNVGYMLGNMPETSLVPVFYPNKPGFSNWLKDQIGFHHVFGGRGEEVREGDRGHQ